MVHRFDATSPSVLRRATASGAGALYRTHHAQAVATETQEPGVRHAVDAIQ